MKMFSTSSVWLLLAAPAVVVAQDMSHSNMGMGSNTGSTSQTQSETSTQTNNGVTTITTTTTVTRTLLWNDEFGSSSAGGNRPDANVWAYDTGPWNELGNGGAQTFTSSASNSYLENGFLNIIARQENQGYTSAALKTEDKMRFRYGSLEIRAKLPNVNAGLWPSFWTLGSNFMNSGWPQAGEIDIMAAGQGLALMDGKINNRVVSGAHWDNAGSYQTSSQARDFNVNLYQGFHTYKLEWTPQALQTFVDDQLVWEMNIDRSLVSNVDEFHQHHFLVMMLAVGGGFTSASAGQACGSSSPFGPVSPNTCPVRGANQVTAPVPGVMQIDYVRLYNNGFSEVIFGSGSVLYAGGTGSTTTTTTGTGSSANVVTQTGTQQQGPCVRDMDCNFATQWCEIATGTCFEKRVGNSNCFRDRVCWSNNCRGEICIGGVAPEGFTTQVNSVGSTSSTTTTAAYLLPASDVRCVRDIDCNFSTEWCEIATSTCFFKRPGGTSCERDRICWSGNCQRDFCRGGTAPNGFTYTSSAQTVTLTGNMNGGSTTVTGSNTLIGSTNGGMTGTSTTTNTNMNGGSTLISGMNTNTNVNMNGGSTTTTGSSSTTNTNIGGSTTTTVTGSTTNMNSESTTNNMAITTTPAPTPRPTLRPTTPPVMPPTLPPVVPATPPPTPNPTMPPVMPPTLPPVVPATPPPTPNPTMPPVMPPTFPPVVPATPAPTPNPTEAPLVQTVAETAVPVPAPTNPVTQVAVSEPVSDPNPVGVSEEVPVVDCVEQVATSLGGKGKGKGGKGGKAGGLGRRARQVKKRGSRGRSRRLEDGEAATARQANCVGTSRASGTEDESSSSLASAQLQMNEEANSSGNWGPSAFFSAIVAGLALYMAI